MTAPTLRGMVTLVTAGVSMFLTTPATAGGPQKYPDRAIKIVVPFGAGGTPDTLARIVADKLQSKWNRPVVVENRPGATGNIGAETVARAEPDGYTLLVAPPPPIAVNQHLFKGLRFDPAAFVPITIISVDPNVLVARPGLPADSVTELIALASSQPGRLTYGSTGRGSTMHLSVEMLKSLSGVNITHVAYKSLPEYINDMLGGSIDLAFANLVEALPLIESGRLKALAVGSVERSTLLNKIPALVGTLPGFVSTTWFAVAAPPKTPPHVVMELSSAIAAGLRETDAAARLEKLHVTPVLNSPSDAAAFIAAESERWRKVIVAAGIKPE